MAGIYDFSAASLSGEETSLSSLRGKVLLIVNTASKCGFTPQYAGLEQLQQTYADQGFTVLGFPCDQFGHQEPGDAAEIASFCSTKYDVSFPMFAKVEVNGSHAHPLWAWLKSEKSGFLVGAIKWNFTKFLVGRDGTVLERFPPTTTPASLAPKVEAALKAADNRTRVTTLTVDLDAIAANWRWLRARHGRPIAAIVKADAYGLGADRVAPRLFAEGARHFFTAYPQEGAALRPLLPGAAAGHMPGPMIAILNGLLAGQAELYLRHDLAPVLGNLDEVAAWSTQATRLGRFLPALIHIDTGMNRLGLGAADIARLIAQPDLLRGIETLFVMTHLANADTPNDSLNAFQARALADCGGFLPGVPRSLANSSGLLVGQELASDLGRPGAAVYGINPTPGAANPMRTVLRLSAPVLQLRDIGVGEAVGYNGIWTAQRPTRVATVSAGYADGYHRILSNRAEASFDGRRLPLIGRVSMDLATFDATDCPGLRQGDELELIGPAVPPDEVAAWAGTNGYEVLTSLKPRGGRVYASL